MRRAIRLIPVVLLATTLGAQQSKFDFSIKNIMRGPELYGREPAQVRWSPDGQWIYFNWLPAGTDWRDTQLRPYRVKAAAGSKPESMTPAQMEEVGVLIANGAYSPDRTRRAVDFNGDLYIVDLSQGNSVRRLTETLAIESAPRFSNDGQKVLFLRDGNAYSLELSGGLTKQLTDIRAADAVGGIANVALGGRGGGVGSGRGGAALDGPTPPQRGGAVVTQRGSLEADQRALFEVIRDQARADSIRRAETALRPAPMIKTVTLMTGERLGNLSVSPNGSAVIFTTFLPASEARNGIVPNYVTASGYTEEINGRGKVGDAQGNGRIGYQSLPSGDVKWLRPIDSDTAANGNVVGWNESGTQALIVGSARNLKTRQLSTVDAATGAVKAIDVLRDTAWVGGPCGFNCAGFYDGGKRVYFVSESNGFAQLYSTAADGSDKQALTGSGKWEIYDVALSNDRKSFYFHSSETSAFNRDFYQMSINDGARTKLTVGLGSHTVSLSPDEQWLADVYSTANRPGEVFVGKRGTSGAQLTTSPTADWLAFNWLKSELIMIPASDGVKVPAHIYKPKDVGARSNGAAVIFVHGAGYLHNVTNGFKANYPREYMFNQYLASKGYTVIDIDYRGSAGYGRDWRTAIYRFMGGRDLQDQVDGSKYLTNNFGINPERIGMYGGSYGGFMTLMALFTEPKYFGAGAALRSVTDWAHYNHGYTGAILNLPQNDSIAYHRSSPIFHAEGLEDPLLMLHGMVDTNVNFQDIVLLTQRLIELGKKDWSLAPYPVEDHGFVRPSSWTDEYGRIFDFFEKTIGPNGSKVRGK